MSKKSEPDEEETDLAGKLDQTMPADAPRAVTPSPRAAVEQARTTETPAPPASVPMMFLGAVPIAPPVPAAPDPPKSLGERLKARLLDHIIWIVAAFVAVVAAQTVGFYTSVKKQVEDWATAETQKRVQERLPSIVDRYPFTGLMG